jgi:hypothetical protein
MDGLEFNFINCFDARYILMKTIVNYHCDLYDCKNDTEGKFVLVAYGGDILKEEETRSR